MGLTKSGDETLGMVKDAWLQAGRCQCWSSRNHNQRRLSTHLKGSSPRLPGMAGVDQCFHPGYERSTELEHESRLRSGFSATWLSFCATFMYSRVSVAFDSLLSHGSVGDSVMLLAPSRKLGLAESTGGGDASARSIRGIFWRGEVWVTSEWNDVCKDTGSDERICMPPYLRAASSCGESGRAFLLSFWRRFWNQI